MLDIFEYISGLGIKKGDILILHSSMEGLRSASPDPKVIIDYLLNLLGPEGTLVIPAFATANRKYSAEKIPTYNPKKSLCWTGMIPNVVVKHGSKSIKEMKKEPYLECIKFSAFQTDPYSGFFGGD